MKKLVALAAALAFVLSACGGDGGGGGRPSTTEISDALKGGDTELSSVTTGASDEVIDCIAKTLHDSDVSDDALQALVDGDEDFEGTDDDQDAIEAVTSDLQACATAA